MFRKTLSIASLILVSSSTLVAAGCASGNSGSSQPYALTGSEQSKKDLTTAQLGYRATSNIPGDSRRW
jgi:hypothetical protein